MERELLSKEQQLTELMKKQHELEMKLIHINLNETETKNDNERLQREKVQLEEQLHEITKDFEESKHYISQLQIQTKKDKRDRAKLGKKNIENYYEYLLFRQALNLTENLAIERESLVKELDTLKLVHSIFFFFQNSCFFLCVSINRSLNKRLVDERDLHQGSNVSCEDNAENYSNNFKILGT